MCLKTSISSHLCTWGTQSVSEAKRNTEGVVYILGEICVSKPVSFKHHQFTAAVLQMASSFGQTLLTSLMKLPSVSMQICIISQDIKKDNSGKTFLSQTAELEMKNAWKKKKREDSSVNIDVGNLSTSLHKEVNAAALILEPECAPSAFLYCKATFCSKKII